MREIIVVIKHSLGLHLRPAAQFVRTADQYASQIQVRNISRDTGFQNAKSTIGVMMLKVMEGHEILIRAEGDDEEAAIEGLRTLVENDFSE